MRSILPGADAIPARREFGSKATAQELRTLLGHVSQEFLPWHYSGITKGMVERSYCIERWTASMRLQVPLHSSMITFVLVNVFAPLLTRCPYCIFDAHLFQCVHCITQTLVKAD